MDVSNLIATFYSTPTKRTVDCGIPFPFFLDAASNTIPFPMVPSKTTVKPAIDGLVPFFPSDFFNRSPSIPLNTTKVLPSTSNDPPPSKNDINPPASDFFHIKEAISQLSFQKRETIHASSSNSISTVPDSQAQDRLVVDSFPPLHPSMNRQDENTEVTDFLGWAINSLRRVLSRECEQMKELRWDTACTLEEEEQMIRFLDGMRIFHTDAVLDEEYLHDFYPPCHQLTNKGWLSLVAKPFFFFA
jgi:hypothetical protein